MTAFLRGLPIRQQSEINRVTAGNLDVSMKYYDKEKEEWAEFPTGPDAELVLFIYVELWDPDVVVYELIKVENLGFWLSSSLLRIQR